jgi:uncharacterized protein
VQFEWDPLKDYINIKKHAVSFREAATVFLDPLSATFFDHMHSDIEDRYIIIGYSSQNDLLVIAYTEIEKNIRIISARHATALERKRHEESEK